MPRARNISIRVWTERFLGTKNKCEELLDLMESMDGGIWSPQRWSECEPVRSAYTPDARSLIQSKWIQEIGGGISHEMFFRRKKPNAEIWVSSWREKVPRLNSVSIYLEVTPFAAGDGIERIKSIIVNLINWSQAVYATAWHTEQLHFPQAQMTPLHRLERIDWLSYFGRPYLELFGGEQRVLSAPCFSAERVAGGVLLLASPRPDSPNVTNSDQVLLALEQYLGTDAFANEHYPDVPCRVPKFDLSETVNGLDTQLDKDGSPRPFEPIILKNSRTEKPSAVVILS